MRGGFVHNQLLVGPIAQFFSGVGTTVRLEHPVTAGRATGYVDLLVEYYGQRLVFEGELSTKRMKWDFDKAKELNAVLLGIIVPNGGIARAGRRLLAEFQGQDMAIWVLTPASALQWVKDNCHLMTMANVSATLNPEKASRQPSIRIGTP